MTRKEFRKHWHNLRVMKWTKREEYPVRELASLIKYPREIAYGYKRGAMSIMQQPITKDRKCRDCGIIFHEKKLKFYLLQNLALLVLCHSCQTNRGELQCTQCGTMESPTEIHKHNGVCYKCYEKQEETL